MSGYQGPNTWFPALHPPPTPEQRACSSHRPPRFFPTTPQSLGEQESLVCAFTPKPSTPASGHSTRTLRDACPDPQSSQSVLILQPKQGAGGQGDTVETTQMKSDHLREMHERKPKFCSQKKSLEDLEPEGEIMSTNTCHGEKAGRERSSLSVVHLTTALKHEWPPRLWSNTPCCQSWNSVQSQRGALAL